MIVIILIAHVAYNYYAFNFLTCGVLNLTHVFCFRSFVRVIATAGGQRELRITIRIYRDQTIQKEL